MVKDKSICRQLYASSNTHQAGKTYSCSESHPDGISKASLQRTVCGVVDAALCNSERGYGDKEGELYECIQ